MYHRNPYRFVVVTFAELVLPDGLESGRRPRQLECLSRCARLTLGASAVLAVLGRLATAACVSDRLEARRLRVEARVEVDETAAGAPLPSRARLDRDLGKAVEGADLLMAVDKRGRGKLCCGHITWSFSYIQ